MTVDINVFSGIHFAVLAFHLFMIAFILYKNPHSWINRNCAILILSFALWSFAYGFLPTAGSSGNALVWVNVAFFGGITQPVAAFYFFMAISGKKRIPRNIALLCVLLLSALVLTYLQISGHYVFDTTLTSLGWIARPADSVVYWIFLLYCQVIFYISLYVLMVYQIKSRIYREKRQALWLLVSSLGALVTGTLTNAFFPLFGEASYAHFGDIPYLIWEIGLILAVFKYGLMSLNPQTASNEILRTMSDSLFLLDSEGNIKMANRAAREFFNLQDGPVIGRALVANLKKPESIRLIISDAEINGQSLNHELEYTMPDNRVITMQVSVSQVKDKLSTPLGYVLVARDISERKKMEKNIQELYQKELEHAKELQEEARDRALFIDMLAHEMRTPLTPMINTSSTLNDVLGSDTSNPLGKLAANLDASVKAMVQRLDELLDVARYSRGSFKINPQRCNIKELFSRTVNIFESSLGSEQKLICQIPDDLPEVVIDAVRLEQVICNLLSNAQKYNSIQGRIFLKVQVYQSCLEIIVQDEGPGIPATEIDKIFAPYHRIKGDRQVSGLGLGLTVCKQIVEAHGGNIRVESKMEYGSTFKVNIPVATF